MINPVSRRIRRTVRKQRLWHGQFVRQIPVDLLEAGYASSHLRHFYNDKEIADFIDSWRCVSTHRESSL